jgi:ribosomal-protein-alanine N-acetyltransferase
MNIEGSNVRLVVFDENHLNDKKYLEWLRDFEVMKYIGREEYLKVVSFEEVIEYVQNVWNNDYIYFYAIYKKENNSFIGTAKINFEDKSGFQAGTADIGIMIGDRNSWGKGLATEVLRVLCNFAFLSLNARKLTAGGLAVNISIIKAFKRIGFFEEGFLRKKVLIGDEYFDQILLGCFPEELN